MLIGGQLLAKGSLDSESNDMGQLSVSKWAEKKKSGQTMWSLQHQNSATSYKNELVFFDTTCSAVNARTKIVEKHTPLFLVRPMKSIDS